MEFIKSFRSLSLTKVNVFLIIFLPISLLLGSLILNLNILIIVLIFIAECTKKKNFFLFKEKSFIFLIIIWIYLIFNSIYVGETSDSIIRAVGFIRFIFLTFAIFFYLNLDSKFYQNTIFKFWTYLFLIVSIDLIFETIFGKNILGYQSTYAGRLASFTGDELKIGGYYFGFISLALAYFYKSNKFSFIFFCVVFFVLSLLIGERANFVKVFLIYLGFIFFIIEMSLIKKMMIFLSLSIVGLLIVINSPHLKSKYYNHIFNVYNDTKVSINQLEPEQILKNKYFSHYYTAINIFKNNPIFGIGLKEFRLESRKKEYSPIKGAYGQGMHPHQIHFEILSELGIIGYILIIFNLFYIIVNVFKKHQNNIFIKSSLLFLVVSFVPIIPSGSFFTTYGAAIYWINLPNAINQCRINALFKN